MQGTNYAKEATVTANETRSAGTGRNFEAENVCNGDSATYWATNDGVNKGTITFAWDEAKPIRYVVLQEHIQLGQRVKAFSIETSNDGTKWTKRGGNIATTTIGYKRIIPLNGSTSNSYEANPQKVKYLRATFSTAALVLLLRTLNCDKTKHGLTSGLPNAHLLQVRFEGSI